MSGMHKTHNPTNRERSKKSDYCKNVTAVTLKELLINDIGCLIF